MNGTTAWEEVLLAWAYQGVVREPGIVALPDTPLLSAGSNQDTRQVATEGAVWSLESAYDHCAQITREHSRTFYLASGLLPPPKRQAIRALYAFCRRSDDLVDRHSQDPRRALQQWHEQSMTETPASHDPVALAWVDTRARFRIPTQYVAQFFTGMEQDLSQVRYETFDQLAEYAYGAASTVGLMAMHIVGFSGPEAIPYAVKLGVALQLTNILRDVAEDWRAGRLYLPRQELEAFGLNETDIAAGRVSDRWLAFLRFQVDRNRSLYAQAWPGIGLLHSDGRFAIAAAADLYQGILDDILAHGGDVFQRRAHLSSWGKLRRLPGIRWRSWRVRPETDDPIRSVWPTG